VSEEPKLRRALVTISALIQDGWISAEAKTEVGNNWLKVVKSNWRDEDVIVCFAEQRTGLMQRPLGQILESKLNATVYLLSGPEQFNRHNINWLVQLTAWAGFIAIIAGLFVLQVNIDRSLTGGVQTVMLVITVLFEFWLIWVWNNLFS
jgi:energy-converting hydrogenase Eha subunit C